jgi:hypothetical protein
MQIVQLSCIGVNSKSHNSSFLRLLFHLVYISFIYKFVILRLRSE